MSSEAASLTNDPDQRFVPNVDPVVLSGLIAKLSAHSVEMAYTLRRTSRSLYVKEGGDFSASILGLHGQLLTVPQEAGSPMFTILDCMPAIEQIENFGPGDVLITNDPYGTKGVATHLPDVQMIQPYFYEGTLVGYGWTFIHSSDIGGRVPSSISPFNTDIFQDGLQIPVVKYAVAGVVNPDIEAIIRRNNRTPDANSADFRAMMSAMQAGEKRVQALIDEVGLETWLQAQHDILAYSAARTRAVIQSLEPGEYRFSDYLDNDGLTSHPVKFVVCITVKPDGTMVIDFTGTDPQVTSAFNIASAGKPHPMLLTRLLGLILTLDPEVPLNGGIAWPVEVIAPEGTVVNAQRPAAVGVRHASAVRINDTLAGAFVAASPLTQAAAGSGVVIPVVVAEPGQDSMVSKVLQSLKGGFGAAYEFDGLDGKDGGYISGLGTPVESSETELDVTVLRYGLRTSSGGAGQWRGGCGRELVFEINHDGTQVLGRGLERFVFRPWGVFGGSPGAATEVIINEGTDREKRHQKIDVLTLDRGETVTIRTPGGGGYGPAWKRDEEAVRQDVIEEFITREEAAELYGVAFLTHADAEFVVDAVRTAELREHLQQNQRNEMYDLGSERRLWERVFTPEWHARALAAVFALPQARRQRVLGELYEAGLAELPQGFPQNIDEDDIDERLVETAIAAASAAVEALVHSRIESV